MNQVEWHQISAQQTIQAHRTGWSGVWDALVAAIRNKPRLTVPTPITLALWVRGQGHVEALIQQLQATAAAPEARKP